MQRKLLWIDLEFDDINCVRCGNILEVGLILTDNMLNEIRKLNIIVHVHQTKLTLSKWSASVHDSSGLLLDVADSQIDIKTCETKCIEFLGDDIKDIIHCGSTMSRDVQFMTYHMPTFAMLLQSGYIDMSTFEIIILRHNPHFWRYFPPKVQPEHRALNDATSTVALARFLFGSLNLSIGKSHVCFRPSYRHRDVSKMLLFVNVTKSNDIVKLSMVATDILMRQIAVHLDSTKHNRKLCYVEMDAIAFLERLKAPSYQFTMCGRNLLACRKLMEVCMPELFAKFHYRYIDLSCIDLILKVTNTILPQRKFETIENNISTEPTQYNIITEDINFMQAAHAGLFGISCLRNSNF